MTSDTPDAPAPDTALESLRKETEEKDKPEEKADGKRKSHKKKPTYTKEGILALLRLPFQVAGAITGYVQEPIPPVIEDPLADSAMQVLNDFGFEVFSKYLNLGVFAALYGTCGIGWFKGFQGFQAEKAARAAEARKTKAAKADDISKPEYIAPGTQRKSTAV